MVSLYIITSDWLIVCCTGNWLADHMVYGGIWLAIRMAYCYLIGWSYGVYRYLIGWWTWYGNSCISVLGLTVRWRHRAGKWEYSKSQGDLIKNDRKNDIWKMFVFIFWTNGNFPGISERTWPGSSSESQSSVFHYLMNKICRKTKLKHCIHEGNQWIEFLRTYDGLNKTHHLFFDDFSWNLSCNIVLLESG